MAIPAIPTYLQPADKGELPPGHRFSLLFPIWQDHDWKFADTQKGQALGKVTPIPPFIRELTKALTRRQIALATSSDKDALLLPGISTSPFATGLGNEHPIENGFAFLSPYGIPYLSGSGVKGVLRRAAEVVALFPGEYPSSGVPADFCMLDVWWLFGFEGEGCSIFPGKSDTSENKKWQEAFVGQFDRLTKRPDLVDFIRALGFEAPKEKAYVQSPRSFLNDLTVEKSPIIKNIHTRGCLLFHDVYPDCKSLTVEIMTPHQSHYLQDGKAPHDCANPNPIPFLAVPAGSEFLFVIEKDRSFPAEKKADWRNTMQAIFQFACKWQGFGAKTAVGYGAISFTKAKAEKMSQELIIARKAEEDKQLLASLSPNQLKIRSFQAAFQKIADAGLKFTPNHAFNEDRLKFFKEALTWTNFAERSAAAEILEQTIKWGQPDKRKVEFKTNLEALRGKIS